MDNKIVQRIVNNTLKELEKDAVKNGADISSLKFKKIKEEVKKKITKKLGGVTH